MTAENIEARVKQLVVDHLGVDEERVTSTANFETDLGADSLDVVELIMAFEEEFSLEISDEKANGIKTVQQAVDFIAAQGDE